jgi:hypothetical protein
MTEVLTVCLVVLVVAVVGTLALVVIPVTRGELNLWHYLRVQRIRRWITRMRKVKQPLHNVRTLDVARTNLRWHLVLTCLFCGVVARALTIDMWWVQVMASLLTIPSIAYLLGSIVQRQKIAILGMRSGLVHDQRERSG